MILLRLPTSQQITITCAIFLIVIPSARITHAYEQSINIQGIGGPSVSELYKRWASYYRTWRLQTSDTFISTNLTYNPTSTGMAKTYFLNESTVSDAYTYHFGGSDAVVDPPSLQLAQNLQFPFVFGSYVIVYNLPELLSDNMAMPNSSTWIRLCLTQSMLTDIMLGKILTWSDARLRAFTDPVRSANLTDPVTGITPAQVTNDDIDQLGVTPPAMDCDCTHKNQFLNNARYTDIRIKIIVRSASASVTQIVTGFLDSISPLWHSTMGVLSSFNSRADKHDACFDPNVDPGSKAWFICVGSSGLAGSIKVISQSWTQPFSISFAPLGDALQWNMFYAAIANQQGFFSVPSNVTLKATLHSTSTASFDVMKEQTWVRTNSDNPSAYPLVFTSNILLRAGTKAVDVNYTLRNTAAITEDMRWINCTTAVEFLLFVDWCVHDVRATSIANQFGFVAMPPDYWTTAQANALTQLKCGTNGAYSQYDQFAAALASINAEPMPLLAVFVLLTLFPAALLEVFTHILDVVISGRRHLLGTGPLWNHFIRTLILSAAETGIACLVLNFILNAMEAVSNREVIITVACPAMIVFHCATGWLLGRWSYEAERQYHVYSQLYKILEKDLRFVDYARAGFVHSIAARTILHPKMKLANEQLQVAWWRGNQVLLRPTSLAFHELKQETRQLLVDAVEWCRIEPKSVSQFVGVVEIEKERFFLSIICPLGDLRTILSNHDNFVMDEQLKFSFAYDVAVGMKEILRQDIIHGNLRSTACYVDSDLTVKVGDWEYHHIYAAQSTSSQIEDCLREELLDSEIETFYPWLYWTAPERLGAAVRNYPLSPNSTSDVYSYGVVLFEIFYRKWPYHRTSEQQPAQQIISSIIIDGLRPLSELEADEVNAVLDSVVTIMERCWLSRTRDRPTLDSICEGLGMLRMHKKYFRDRNFFQNEHAYEELQAAQASLTGQKANNADAAQKHAKVLNRKKSAAANKSSLAQLRAAAIGIGDDGDTPEITAGKEILRSPWFVAPERRMRTVRTMSSYEPQFFPCVHFFLASLAQENEYFMTTNRRAEECVEMLQTLQSIFDATVAGYAGKSGAAGAVFAPFSGGSSCMCIGGLTPSRAEPFKTVATAAADSGGGGAGILGGFRIDPAWDEEYVPTATAAEFAQALSKSMKIPSSRNRNLSALGGRNNNNNRLPSAEISTTAKERGFNINRRSSTMAAPSLAGAGGGRSNNLLGGVASNSSGPRRTPTGGGGGIPTNTTNCFVLASVASNANNQYPPQIEQKFRGLLDKELFDMTELAFATMLACWQAELPPLIAENNELDRFRARFALHSGPVVTAMHGTKPYVFSILGPTEREARHVLAQSCASRIAISARTNRLLSLTCRYQTAPHYDGAAAAAAHVTKTAINNDFDLTVSTTVISMPEIHLPAATAAFNESSMLLKPISSTDDRPPDLVNKNDMSSIIVHNNNTPKTAAELGGSASVSASPSITGKPDFYWLLARIDHVDCELLSKIWHWTAGGGVDDDEAAEVEGDQNDGQKIARHLISKNTLPEVRTHRVAFAGDATG